MQIFRLHKQIGLIFLNRIDTIKFNTLASQITIIQNISS